MRPAQLKQILAHELDGVEHGIHTPVMLWGPPGVGKSDIVRHIAETHHAGVVDVRLSQMEPSDLRGIPFRTENHVEWAVPSLLPDEQRHGQRGILFLDEITSAPPSVSAAAYQLILDRRLGDYRVPDGWAIFAAGNRQGDRGVTYTMPAPLANRFSHYELEVNLDDWVSWAYQHKIDERIIGFLRFRPELLFDFDPAHNPVAFPSPRSWEFAHRALKKFDQQPQLLASSLQGCVGHSAGLELSTYIKSLDQMPDIDAICAGQSKKTPQAIDLQYAVAAALVGRAVNYRDEENHQAIGHILNYAGHFREKEMGVMLVSDLHRVLDDLLFEIQEFEPWAEKVADLLLG